MTKISALSDIGTSVASNDTFVLVDVSDPTTPNKKIQQQNLFLIPDGSAGTPGLRFLSDTNVGLFRPTTDTLAIATGGSERLRIDSSGRLGLGVSDPVEKLVVAGATANIGIYNTTPGSTASPSYSRLNFYGYLQTTLWNVASISAGNSASNTYGGILQFATNTVGGTHTTALTIDSSQRVGIGTTSPSRKLEVSDAGVDNFIRVDSNGATKTGIEFASSATVYSQLYFNNVAPYDLSLLQQYTTGSLIFGTNNTERARIDSSGRLLVGTSTPVDTDNTGLVVHFSSATGSGGEGGIELYNSSTSANSAANPVLMLYKGVNDTTSNNRFIQFYANGNLTAMGGIVGNGASNVQFASLSDERDKTNIEALVDAAEKIRQLTVVSFDWRNGGGHVNAGFIAQNVETVFPEYVLENVNDGDSEPRKGITGGMSAGYVAVLTAALQEALAKIEILEAKVAALEAQ
jgi:hypothetical protein